MIFTEFASNENVSDSFLGLRLLFQPWKWYKGKDTDNVKKLLERRFFPNHSFFFYLTGRAALYYLLQCLNLPKDTKVLVQAFTCEAVILPILANHLTPIYVDIEDKTFSMELADLQKKYTNQAHVLILQHSFGLTPEHRTEILQFAKDNKLIVVEDLAHGGDFRLYKNDSFKTIKLLSFGRSKAFSSVFGGALVIKDFYINQKIKKNQPVLSQPNFFFIMKCLFYKIITVPIKWSYGLYIGRLIQLFLQRLQILVPEISRQEKQGSFDFTTAKAYPNVLATLLIHQLKKYTNTAKTRKKNVELYKDNLIDYTQLSDQNSEALSLIRFPILVNKPTDLWAFARIKRVFLGKWYNQVVAPKEISLRKMQYISGSCPQAENICKLIINLPTFVSEKDCKKIIKIVNEFERK